MQVEKQRRSNEARARQTRAALLTAARSIFVERSYADTGTPELVAAAGLTRGALYHHYADKKALFRAVVEAEAAAVATEIDAIPADGVSPVEALVTGGEAFLAAMSLPGRTRLLLLDAPAVLGRKEMDAIDSLHAARTLREGLVAAMRTAAIRPMPIEALTQLLSAAYDRAALAIEAGGDKEEWQLVLKATIEGLQTESATADTTRS